MAKMRTVVVTGAAGAIGRATGHLLAAEGYCLFLMDRHADNLCALAATLPGAVALVGDVTDAAFITSGFADASADGLAAVVLAAGYEGVPGRFEDGAEADFDTVMASSVKSVWLGIKHCLRVMKPQGYGRVVAVSSISGVMASPLLAPYAAGKHAVMGLVRTAAREAAAFNVTVNAVCPAPVASDMTRRIDSALCESFPERSGGRPDVSHLVPMRRYAAPEEVAQAVGFLCSPASSYCSGTAFMVDGEFHVVDLV